MGTQGPKRWAAEKLASEWGGGKVDKDSIGQVRRNYDVSLPWPSS
jgi:hypothetical protein